MRFERIRTALRRFSHYRSLRLTSDGTRFILLTLAVGVAAINTGNNLLYLLLAMLLSLIIMSGILSEQCLKQLEIRRRMPEHVFANSPTTAVLSVANRKARLPSYSLRIMDMVAGAAVDRGIRLLHLPPRLSSFHPYPLLIARRGPYRIEGVKLLTRFPFGLFIKAATLPVASEVVVYPEVKPLPERLKLDLVALGHDQALSRRGQGVGLHNLRSYQPGDDSRGIHWKSSARQARLIVRETEAEDQQRVTLAFSTFASDSGEAERVASQFPEAAFEQAVVLTASLAAFFHERAYSVRLLVGREEVPHGLGIAHLYEILRVLGCCRATAAPASVPLPDSFLTLRERCAVGELTILVVPWPDARVSAACQSVSCILDGSHWL